MNMRMLILLAVFWVAGSLLLAAESPSPPKPAATTQTGTKTDAAKAGAAKTDAAKSDAAKADAKTGTKDASKTGAQDSDQGASNKSIAEQAEAALKAAAEADPGSTSKTPQSEVADAEQHAKDDTQTAPTGKGPSPQRFVPTEQVRADFDVSFPIDI